MPGISGSRQARLSDSAEVSTKIFPDDEPVPEIEYESEKSEAPDTERRAADSERTVSGVGLRQTWTES